jgi:hypothetical protein
MARHRCSVQLRNIAKSLTDGRWICAINRGATNKDGEVMMKSYLQLWSAHEFVLARDKLLAHAIHWRRQSAFQCEHFASCHLAIPSRGPSLWFGPKVAPSKPVQVIGRPCLGSL